MLQTCFWNAVKFVGIVTSDTIDTYSHCWPKCCWTCNLPPWPETPKILIRTKETSYPFGCAGNRQRSILLLHSVTLFWPVTKGVVVVK